MIPRSPSGLDDVIAAVLGGHALVALDLGARGDVPAPWRAFEDRARFICVEPDEAACDVLRARYAARGRADRYEVHSVALTREGGARTLHLTASRGGSSLFDPTLGPIPDYTTGEYLHPVDRVVVDTVAVADFIASIGTPAIDLAKLDVQGCELEILEGLPDATLRGLAFVELEAAMHPHGPGYPTFCDIDAFMRSAGFELLDLWPDRQPRSYRGSRRALSGPLGVYDYSPSVSRRIWEVDVLYFRPLPATGADAERSTRVLIACLCAYGFFAEALGRLREAVDSGAVGPALAAELEPHVAAWHVLARRRPWFRTGFPWTQIRGLIRRLGITLDDSGADYIHGPRY